VRPVGSDTEDVLRELGYPDPELARLRNCGVIG
jgi:hypothetical protein